MNAQDATVQGILQYVQDYSGNMAPGFAAYARFEEVATCLLIAMLAMCMVVLLSRGRPRE